MNAFSIFSIIKLECFKLWMCWLKKNPKVAPRFWTAKAEMIANSMYKKLYKDIGTMGLLDDNVLANKIRKAQPANLIRICALTDIDTDSAVESITEPDSPLSLASGGSAPES